MLKNKSELLQKENKDLFGKEFQADIGNSKRLTSNQKSCLQVLFLKTLQVETSPFRKGPCKTNNIAGSKLLQNSSKQNNLFQGDANSDSTRKITICSQAAKKIILVESTSKYSDSRKTETLSKKVGTSNKGSEHFRSCKEPSNSFSFSTPATAVTKGNSFQSKGKICSGGEDWKSLEKVCNRKI